MQDHKELIDQNKSSDIHGELLNTENLEDKMEQDIDHILTELSKLKEFLNGERIRQKELEKSFS